MNTNKGAGFYTSQEVLGKVPVSYPTLWRMWKVGDFPSPVKISPRRNGFPREAVDRWIAEREGVAA